MSLRHPGKNGWISSYQMRSVQESDCVRKKAGHRQACMIANNILADMVGYWYSQLIILSHRKETILENVSLNIFLYMDFFELPLSILRNQKYDLCYLYLSSLAYFLSPPPKPVFLRLSSLFLSFPHPVSDLQKLRVGRTLETG